MGHDRGRARKPARFEIELPSNAMTRRGRCSCAGKRLAGKGIQRPCAIGRRYDTGGEREPPARAYAALARCACSPFRNIR